MSPTERAFLIPEVLQTSSMDCGPAALKAVLQGFGIAAGYDALRARCQTDVDGTSIDALAALGAELGLQSQQVLVPRDHFLLPEARCLPAIVATRSAGGLLHFVVVWRACGPFVQILDPGSGRRWLRRAQLLGQMPDLPIPLSIERWRAWAESQTALRPWRARLRRLGLKAPQAELLLARAARDAGWQSFALLDAATRFVTALADSGALSRGRSAARLLEKTLEKSEDPGSDGDGCVIPPRFFWVTADGAPAAKLIVRGSVIVQFARRETAPITPRHDTSAPELVPPRPEPAARGTEPEPMRVLWRLVLEDTGPRLVLLAGALLAHAGLIPLEGLLLRALLDMDRKLALDYQRVTSVLAVLCLIVLGLWLDHRSTSAVRGLGRRLETRLRVALLDKLPELPHDYLASRPSSDMAARGHAVHLLCELPALWAQRAKALLGLLATTLGLLWLAPVAAPLILALVLLAALLPQISRRSLVEASLRLRTHTSALDRFHLDALIGASPVRVHGAERNVCAEHEELLIEWARTADALHAKNTRVECLQAFSTQALAITLVASQLGAGQGAKVLLLVYWAMRVAITASELASAEQGLRGLAAVAVRLLAPLQVPDVERAAPSAAASRARPERRRGAALSFEAVTVSAGGHTLLEEIQLDVPAGSHVAIVGASGSGKSSLLGLLLGWLRPATGTLRVDGEVLDLAGISELRQETAWVDPAVQLWSGSLYDNLTYGDDREAEASLPQALERAELLEVLEALPDGMQSEIGESGARLSGGQGQRVRLARALMRPRARLVLLDEPFRGLERERRRSSLDRVRAHWPEATLLFVSHDIEDTLGFERVLVLDGGRLVEDGSPEQLLRCPGSRYAGLLAAAGKLRDELWSSGHWQRRSLRGGRLGSEHGEEQIAP